MKIVLTGFMGTGKTSVGRELSRRLGYEFIDTDDLIEERERMPISLIFKKKGEEYFRKVERETVKEVSKRSDVVIATGGGVIKNPDNVNDLRRDGIIIWLKASPEIIMKRVMLEGGKRPLLEVDEPLKEIKRLLSERLKFYEQADTWIDTDYITPGETAQEIVERLGMYSEKVRVLLDQGRSYDIVIGNKLIDKTGLLIKQFRPSMVGIVSNETIFPIYKDLILNALKSQGFTPEVIVIPDGEEYKDMMWAYHIHGELLKAKFDRRSLLLAFGGGVVGDITGFVASTFMRGIRYVQIPTTLLAQVDSSVGGKTGVNHSLGKNMIGTFYQPSLVIIDIDVLRTLPRREFFAGMAEVIKYGVIADRELFNSLKDKRQEIISLGDELIRIITRSCEIKADVVSKDERESGLRAILNFGHTIGHALETVTGYKRFLHGEAVGIGMCVAAGIAVKMNMLNKQEARLIEEMVSLYNLPNRIPSDIDVNAIMEAMEIDKKAQFGKLRLVLPETIGRVNIVEDVDRDLIRDTLRSFLEL